MCCGKFRGGIHHELIQAVLLEECLPRSQCSADISPPTAVLPARCLSCEGSVVDGAAVLNSIVLRACFAKGSDGRMWTLEPNVELFAVST